MFAIYCCNAAACQQDRIYIVETLHNYCIILLA